jgi:hypothetical protein
MFLIPFLLALLTPEVAVTPATLQPATFTHAAAVAANGDRALAVWVDFRGTGDVYGARVAADGTLLDPTGIRLYHGRATFAAAPAPDGGWLVAVAAPEGATYVVRVSRDGAPSPPKKIDDTAPVGSNGVQVVTNGETFLVLISGTRALLVGLGGNVVAGPFTLASMYSRAAVASNGRDYLVATNDQHSVITTVVTRSGGVGPAQVLIPGIAPIDIAMASDGNRYFIAAPTPPGSIVTAFAAADGTLIGVPQSAQQLHAYTIRAVTDGRDFGLLWNVIPSETNPRTLLYGSPIDSFGRIANPQLLRAIGGDSGFDLAALGGSVLVVHGDDFRLFGAFTTIASLGGPLLPDFPIAKSAAAETGAVMTATSSGAVVRWLDLASSRWRAEALDGAGQPAGRIIDIAPSSSTTAPQVAFDGTNVVFSWSRIDGKLVAQRFDTALNAVDSEPIPISSVAIGHKLAAGGGVALFVWTSNDTGGSNGAILTRNGTVVPVALPQVPFAAAAWNGSEFLVAYAFATGPPPTQGLFPDPRADVRALRVAPDGQVLDAAPHTIAHLQTGVAAIAVASNGGRFLAAWRPDLYQRFGVPSIIAGKYANADGTTDAAPPIALSSDGVADGPFLTAFGSGYALAWQTRPANDRKVLLWRTTEAGSIESLPPMASAYYGGSAAIAAIGDRIVLAYSHVDDAAGGVERVFVRSVSAPGRRRASGR